MKPGYARLQVGVLQGEEPEILPLAPGALSQVPHAEPTWLTRGFYSPYFNDVSAPELAPNTEVADLPLRAVEPQKVPSSHAKVRG